MEELDVKPFKHYPEEFNEEKLPSAYVENTFQEFTTAQNYSLKTASCSETLILIKTARKNSKRRLKMRKELKKLKDVNHYFMLGTSENGSNTNKILAESDQNNDIIIGNFIDDYYNLTVKSLSALQWSIDVCTETKSIVLCDDDVHFNDPKVIRSLASKMFRDHNFFFQHNIFRYTIGNDSMFSDDEIVFNSRHASWKMGSKS